MTERVANIRSTPLSAEQQHLVKNARGLVDRVARGMAHRYAGFARYEDLVSLGHEGLVQAAQTFDDTLGVPFEPFAWSRVQGAMLNGMRRDGSQRALYVASVRAAHTYLENQHNDSDIMNDTDEDVRKRFQAFSDGLAATMFASYVHTAASEITPTSTEQAYVDHDSYQHAMKALTAATEQLPERDQKLIELHYKKGETLRDVAKALKVSYATIRRHHAAVMDRLAIRLRALGITEPPPLTGGT